MSQTPKKEFDVSKAGSVSTLGEEQKRLDGQGSGSQNPQQPSQQDSNGNNADQVHKEHHTSHYKSDACHSDDKISKRQATEDEDVIVEKEQYGESTEKRDSENQKQDHAQLYRQAPQEPGQASVLGPEKVSEEQEPNKEKDEQNSKIQKQEEQQSENQKREEQESACREKEGQEPESHDSKKQKTEKVEFDELQFEQHQQQQQRQAEEKAQEDQASSYEEESKKKELSNPRSPAPGPSKQKAEAAQYASQKEEAQQLKAQSGSESSDEEDKNIQDPAEPNLEQEENRQQAEELIAVNPQANQQLPHVQDAELAAQPNDAAQAHENVAAQPEVPVPYYPGVDLPAQWFIDSGFPAHTVPAWIEIFRQSTPLNPDADVIPRPRE